MPKPRTKEERKSNKIKTWRRILLALILLLTFGILCEQVCERADGKKFTPPGQLIDINGHAMHIWAEGSGDATVVFAAGFQIPCAYVDFYPLYGALSRCARVAVYERPGYGWSEVAKTPRDIDTITAENHELLVKSGEKPPYILVGHSIGALETLRFAQMYREEVKGVVLIDGSNPGMYIDMPEPSAFSYFRTAAYKEAIAICNKTGISRLLFQTVYPYASTPMSAGRNGLAGAAESMKALDEAMFLRTFNNRNQINEGKMKEKNADTVLSHGRLGELPLVIFTSEYLNSFAKSRQDQADLLNWSSASKQIIVEGANHALHWSDPDVIAAEILNMPG